MAVIIPAFIPRTGVDRYTQQQIIDAVPQPLGINSPGVSGLDDGWKSVYIENPEYKKARGGGGGSSSLSPEAEPVDEKGRPIPKFIQFRKGDPKNNAPKGFRPDDGAILNTAPVQLFNADGTPIKQPNAFKRLDDMYVVDTKPTKGNSLIPQVVGREELPFITGEKMKLKPNEYKQLGSGDDNIASIMITEEYANRDPENELQERLYDKTRAGERREVMVFDKAETEKRRQAARQRWEDQNAQMQLQQAKLMMENPGMYGTPEQIAARDAEIAKSGLGAVPDRTPEGRPIPDSIRAKMRPGDSYEGGRIIRGSTSTPPRLQPLPTLGMTPYEEPGPVFKTIDLSKPSAPARARDTSADRLITFVGLNDVTDVGTSGAANKANADLLSSQNIGRINTGNIDALAQRRTSVQEDNFRNRIKIWSDPQYGKVMFDGLTSPSRGDFNQGSADDKINILTQQAMRDAIENGRGDLFGGATIKWSPDKKSYSIIPPKEPSKLQAFNDGIYKLVGHFTAANLLNPNAKGSIGQFASWSLNKIFGKPVSNADLQRMMDKTATITFEQYADPGVSKGQYAGQNKSAWGSMVRNHLSLAPFLALYGAKN